MKKNDLRSMTKEFALGIVHFVKGLPRDGVCNVLGNQLLRSGTSPYSNYRAACRAKSTADFIYKLGIVEEEADESIGWMELLGDSKLIEAEKMKDLINRADQILAMTVASIKTARKKKYKK